MFSKDTYTNRRKILKQSFQSGILLFLGNDETGMNYKSNTYPFRQDSNFLYYFGIDQPHLIAIIDIDEGNTILFGNELTMEDIVWMGDQPSLSDLATAVGVHEVKPYNKISTYLQSRTVHFLPPYRAKNKINLSKWLDIPISNLQSQASIPFIKSIVKQRSIKTTEEIEEMEKALSTTHQMHTTAMQIAKVGMTEAEIAGIVEGIAISAGGRLAYPVILSKDGQILHNHHHHNILQEGQLILGDFGAETASCYAGDITRTFPVSKTFTTLQKDIYNIVLAAEMQVIEQLKPRVSYRTMHDLASTIIVDGLKELGLMKGTTDDAVELGAHALFFPHGLGHMIGLDVHDMEDLGENYVGYDEQTQRSTLFGTAYLRLGRQLQSGFVLTVEPGIYFIPQLIDQWKAEQKFTDFINYDKLESYKTFGGIRIEDNVLITETGHRVLGPPIAKTIEAIEALRQS